VIEIGTETDVKEMIMTAKEAAAGTETEAEIEETRIVDLVFTDDDLDLGQDHGIVMPAKIEADTSQVGVTARAVNDLEAGQGDTVAVVSDDNQKAAPGIDTEAKTAEEVEA
jgi:hypothetical protein